MKKFWLLGVLIILGMVFLLVGRFLPPSISQPSISQPSITPPRQTISYESRNLPDSTVHILLIPANSKFLVTPALSEKVATVEEFAGTNKSINKAIAVVNAGFFDPSNQKSTSYVVLSGKLVADPKENKRLTDNPNLKPYLNKIFNRTEFRRYECDKGIGEKGIRYDIVLHNEQPPTGCQLIDALGGGPQLLPELTLVEEGFVDYRNGRDPIGSKRPNARTAVGITGDVSIVLVMVAQKASAPANSGMSLPALADFMKTLGVEKAMNLDGGSSSSFYYNGKSFYGKLDEQGNPIKRPVKSVLFVWLEDKK